MKIKCYENKVVKYSSSCLSHLIDCWYIPPSLTIIVIIIIIIIIIITTTIALISLK